MFNWNEFRSKYKQEIRVGIVVFAAYMLMSVIKFIIFIINKN